MEETNDFYGLLRIIFPTVTLLLGIAINRFYDYFLDRKKIKKSGKRWVAEIRSLESPITLQITALQEFIEELKDNGSNPSSLTLFSILKCDIFKSLDKNDLLEYIKMSNKLEFENVIEVSNKVHGLVSILTQLFEAQNDQFVQFKSDTSDKINELNKNLNSASRTLATYGTLIEKEINTDPFQDPRFKKIADLFSINITAKIQSDKSNLYKFEIDSFLPILKELSELRLDQRTQAFLTSITSCIDNLKEINMIKQYLVDATIDTRNRYQSQLNNLKSIVEEIDVY